MKIILPELGEGIDSVEVTDILVKKGDQVKPEDVLLVVESEKASMEIPSEKSGKISTILINKGDSVKPGDTIFEINASSEKETTPVEGSPSESENLEEKTDEPPETPLDTSESISNFKAAPEREISPLPINSNSSASIIATPSVRKLARELGCDLSKVKGSEKNNRITKEDVLNHIKFSLQQSPSSERKENKPEVQTSKSTIDENQFLKFGSIEKISFNKIRSVTAKRMSESWTSVPHVTHFDEVRIDHLLTLKKEIELLSKNKKVSILAFIAHSLIKTLSLMKKFNSTADIDNQVLIVKNYINLGIAVDTPKGLLVPVIKNAEKKSIKNINDSILSLSDKARTGGLAPNDMSGGTFTISSLGGIGGKFFTPIINYPEVAIMGVSRAYTKTELDRYNLPYQTKVLPFSLSYDHRVIDGAEAARFCNLFKKMLTDLSSSD